MRSIRCGLLLPTQRGLSMLTTVSCAKAAEPIGMPLGMRICVDTMKNVLGGGRVPTREGALLGITCVLGHAQLCDRSIYSALFASGSSRQSTYSTRLTLYAPRQQVSAQG